MPVAARIDMRSDCLKRRRAVRKKKTIYDWQFDEKNGVPEGHEDDKFNANELRNRLHLLQFGTCALIEQDQAVQGPLV